MDRRAAATWLGRLDAPMAELGALHAELAASLPAAAALAAEWHNEGPEPINATGMSVSGQNAKNSH